MRPTRDTLIRRTAPALLCAVLFACGARSSSAPPQAAASPAPSAAPAAATASSAQPAPSEAPSASEAAAAQQEEDEASDQLVEHHRHHHRGGVTAFIAMSLETLGVSPEQHAALEKIQAELDAHLKPAQAADARFLATLADGIASGAIDKAKVDTAIGPMEAASASVHAASIAALNKLHAALTPEQRSALVDKVRAHWEVWQQANAVEGEPAHVPKHGRVDALARDLDLTTDQIDKIRASLTSGKTAKHFEPAKVEAHLRAFEASFAGDSFDAKTLPAGKEADAAMTGWAAERTARFFEAVAPVLTSQQKSKLAKDLRAHANQKDSE